MIELLFQNGAVVTGESWREVEDMLRASQWDTFPTRRAFRRELRARAKLWSGRDPPSPSPTSRHFLESLADAELFQIIER